MKAAASGPARWPPSPNTAAIATRAPTRALKAFASCATRTPRCPTRRHRRRPPASGTAGRSARTPSAACAATSNATPRDPQPRPAARTQPLGHGSQPRSRVRPWSCPAAACRRSCPRSLGLQPHPAFHHPPPRSAHADHHHQPAPCKSVSAAAIGHCGCSGGDPACPLGLRACGKDWDPPQLLPPG